MGDGRHPNGLVLCRPRRLTCFASTCECKADTFTMAGRMGASPLHVRPSALLVPATPAPPVARTPLRPRLPSARYASTHSTQVACYAYMVRSLSALRYSYCMRVRLSNSPSSTSRSAIIGARTAGSQSEHSVCVLDEYGSRNGSYSTAVPGTRRAQHLSDGTRCDRTGRRAAGNRGIDLLVCAHVACVLATPMVAAIHCHGAAVAFGLQTRPPG